MTENEFYDPKKKSDSAVFFLKIWDSLQNKTKVINIIIQDMYFNLVQVTKNEIVLCSSVEFCVFEPRVFFTPHH